MLAKVTKESTRALHRRAFSAAAAAQKQSTPKWEECASGKWSSLPGVNGRYQHDKRPLPEFKPRDNSKQLTSVPAKHAEEWSVETTKQAVEDHVMFSWNTARGGRDMAALIERGEGPYLIDSTGRKYIDFSSGAVCGNLGHTVPQEIISAINDQLSKTPFVYSDTYMFETRARLSSLLSDVFPGDLNAFIFMNSGAEANECAIRMARHMTGRPKIMSRHRSYHGGTMATLHMTGDARTHYVTSQAPATGFLKIFDPLPLSFDWAPNEDMNTAVTRCLEHLHEQIIHENPNTIAAIVMESITGTNGWLIPPAEYMQGVRALCDQYGILLICDEVMVGFGRTGKWFGFQQWPGVMPDMVSFAKGVSSSIQPVSGVAMRPHVQEHFQTHPIPYGSTFCHHPVGMAAAYANVKYLLDNDIVQNAANMESVMAEEMSRIVEKHPTVKAARIVGLAGGLDMQNPNDGTFMPGPEVLKFRKMMRDLPGKGLITLSRDHFVHTTPPLNSTEEQIREGWDVMDRALSAYEAQL